MFQMSVSCSVDLLDEVDCLLLPFPVFCVYRSPGDGHMRRVPAPELCAEAGCAAADDCHLLTADGGFLHLTVHPLRHGPPQHRVRDQLKHVFFAHLMFELQ